MHDTNVTNKKIDGILAALETCTPEMWFGWARNLLTVIEADPLWKRLLEKIPLDKKPYTEDWLVKPGPPPSDLKLWGECAYASLKAFDSSGYLPTPGNLFTQLARNQFDRYWQDSRDHVLWNSRAQPAFNHQFILPLVLWLRTERITRTVAEYHLSRWVRRTQAFGTFAGIADLDERKHLQPDLHRFLFDAGIDFKHAAREVQVGLGKVDFLFQIGSENATVEVMLLKNMSNNRSIKTKLNQAVTYPHSFNCHLAYLVIAYRNESYRLDLPPPFHKEPLLLNGVELRILLLDLTQRYPSQDNRKLKVLPLDEKLLTISHQL